MNKQSLFGLGGLLSQPHMKIKGGWLYHMRTNEKNEISAWEGDWRHEYTRGLKNSVTQTTGTTCVPGRVVPTIILRTSCPSAWKGLRRRPCSSNICMLKQ